MRRRRRRVNYRKLAVTACLIAAVPILFKLFVATIPYVGAAAEKAAFLSAGIALPEGGQRLLDAGEIGSGNHTEPETDQDMPAPEDTTSSQDTPEPQTASQEPETTDTGVTQAELDQYSNNDGPVVRKTYTAGSTPNFINISGNAFVKNTTKLPNETVQQAVHNAPAFKLTGGSEPQVLIMHTHTTECYELAARDFYDSKWNSRNRDKNRNRVRVGDEITKQLEAAGIGVIHDATEHDYPSYNGAYDRSRVTVQNILAQYPSIKVVLDIHRDAISTDDGTRYAPVAEINGKNAAQVMIISGCDDGTMDYPNYLQNLSFASLLQQQMESDYPGLTRPIMFAYRFYNQNLTTGSLLIEVGGHANSLDEAIYSGELVGKSLANALKTITE